MSAATRRKIVRPRQTRALNFESLEDRRVLATFLVNNLTDGPVAATGDLTGSLRQAVFDANATAGDDTIMFSPGLSGTIALTAGQIDIIESLEIEGPGSHVITISGNYSSRVLNIDDGNASTNQLVEIRGITLSGGDTGTAGFDNDGGALRSFESLVLDNAIVIDNYADDDGGGIWVDPAAEGGEVTIRHSLLTGNRSRGFGGGAHLAGTTGNTLTIEHTTFAYNRSNIGISGGGGGGGGLDLDVGGSATIRYSTFSGNVSENDDGGGIFLDAFGEAEVLLSGVTISGNTAVRGAGLEVFGPTQGEGGVTIEHSTITGNLANGNSVDNGGGMYLFFTNVTLNHTIVAGNEAFLRPMTWMIWLRGNQRTEVRARR